MAIRGSIGTWLSVFLRLIQILFAMILFFACSRQSEFHYSGYRPFTFMMWWTVVIGAWSLLLAALSALLLCFPTAQLDRRLVLAVAAVDWVLWYVLLGTVCAAGAVQSFLEGFNRYMRCPNCVEAVALGAACSILTLASAICNLRLAARLFS